MRGESTCAGFGGEGDVHHVAAARRALEEGGVEWREQHVGDVVVGDADREEVERLGLRQGGNAVLKTRIRFLIRY